eukprot:5908093-Pyramimonas_sp.AAC.1
MFQQPRTVPKLGHAEGAQRARDKIGRALGGLMGLTHMDLDSLGVVRRESTHVAQVFKNGRGGQLRTSKGRMGFTWGLTFHVLRGRAHSMDG